MHFKLIGSTVFAAALGITLIVLSLKLGDTTQAVALNIAMIVVGLSAGWLSGILLSPYTKREESKFSEYAKAFGVFASGYLVGKIDKVVEQVFQPEFILESNHGFRVLAFASSLIIAMIVTFIYREYAR